MMMFGLNAVACSSEDSSVAPDGGPSETPDADDGAAIDGATGEKDSSAQEDSSDARSVPDTSPVSDASTADVALPVFDGGASCSPLAVSSTVVTPSCITSALPTATGGTIVAGTYELESIVHHSMSGCPGYAEYDERGTLEIVDHGTYVSFHEFSLYPNRTQPPLGLRNDWKMEPTQSSPTLLGRSGEPPCTVGGLRGFDGYTAFTGADGRARIGWGADYRKVFVKTK